MDASRLASFLDATLLAPATQPDELDRFIADAAAARVAAVCFSPCFLPRAVPEPLETAVVIGFPSGLHTPEAKAYEAAQAVSLGATELDMVINVPAAIRHDFAAVTAEIRAVREAADRAGAALPASARPTLKVILETAALDDTAIVECCGAAETAGADFVKTSTGFHPAGGASLEAVRLMAETVGERLGVKASGGIRDRATAEAMLAAGATRLGVSAFREILS